MTNIKTVSDTKRAFYSHHTKPINSVYRRVVEELMVEMHLLSVNSDFKHDAIYYLGVVSSYDRLMEGYQPEQDKESIFKALCHSIDQDPGHYRAQAEQILAIAESKSAADIVAWLQSPEGDPNVTGPIAAISSNEKFKYSRIFAIGLYSLLEKAEPELIKDKEKSQEIFTSIVESLNLPQEKTSKDLDTYRGSLEKMTQLLQVMEDMLEASRKQREKRATEKAEREQAQAAKAEADATEETKVEEVKAEETVES